MRLASEPAQALVLSAENRARLEQATHLHGLGQLAEAEALYTELLHAPGAQVEVLHYVLGLLKSQGGDPAAALAAFDQALAHGHASVDLHNHRADLLRRAGRRVEALASLEAALALRPDIGMLHISHGMVLAELGRAAEAVAAYDQALAIDPANAAVHSNRGVALENLGEPMLAIESYIEALKVDPVYRNAHHNLGSAALKLEEFEFAAESLERAVHLDPSPPESWNLLGVAMIELERYPEAVRALNRAVTLRPTYAEAYNNLAVALRRTCRFEEAVVAAEKASSLDPSLVEALSSRGLALCRLCRFEEAILDFNMAHAARPQKAAFVMNRGVAREGLGDVAGAIEDFRAAEALDPDLVDAKLNRALTHLRMGDYADGWPLYEHRWKNRFGPFLPYPREQLWLGEGDIAGKTVILWGEQGFGDAIQFCRFATDVAALGAHVVMQVRPPLQRVMRRLLGPERVIAMDETVPFDLFTPLMSLPLALRLQGPAATRRGTYLSADPADVVAWRGRLGEAQGLRVGLAWTGNPGHENDHNRSMPLEALSPLFGAGMELVSLQKVHALTEHGRMAAAGMRSVSEHLNDFADTAALIETCDAVVSVDTSVAHLAAAMGKSTFMLLPHFGDWRWGDGTRETAWYPRAALLRQTAFGDWSAPVAETLDALQLMAAQRG